MQRDYHAHTLEGQPPSKWEPLYTGTGEGHLERVATLAAEFAQKFGAPEWGRLAGLWHDLGKYSEAFQNKLHNENGSELHLEQKSKVDHATAGAQHADRVAPPWGRLLAFAIAGHHAGLADAFGSPSSLEERLKKHVHPVDAAPTEVLSPAATLPQPPLDFNTNDSDIAGFQLAFFGRMIFSCLCDADFLATEAFMNPKQSAARPVPGEWFVPMLQSLNRTLEQLVEKAAAGTVSDCRQVVLAACRQAAHNAPAVFSLTVPTGGGKTLSSLAFALEHARQHDMRRIIYAIPFTSIIEQTASVFRSAMGDLAADVVLEQHSNVDPLLEQESPRSRLAAENWDAPLVVTTNVQLFESIFAARTSRCRKLHNLVGSIIVLDEAQTLPVERLRSCLAVLDELVRNYGCTIVLCTATQPAFNHRDDFPIGLQGVCEIIPQPERLYQAMRRVEVQQLGKQTDEQLIERFLKRESFLTIVNTRAHAAKLYRDLLAEGGDAASLYHLSTLMCGAHRADHIAQIRKRLKHGKPCRVISTQLIEAGVDIDFPIVFRALTGLDSIAQSAGRCNREGRQDMGVVYVFDPAEVQLIGYLKSVAHSAGEIAPKFADLLDPAALQQYFELHYWKQEGENRWDKTSEKGVMNCFSFPFGDDFPLSFRSAADRFRMIEETGRTLFVPYGESGELLIKQLRNAGPSRMLLRKLQRYTVTLYEHLFLAMQPDIEHVHEQYPVLLNPSSYDHRLGVRIDRPGYIEPAALIG